ncbi:amidohydrolase family protein [Pseudonocardia sp. NPDC046786]|uniref:amidohydrolase family protein n=1 Tax=Pseudonocardia sp. NPDC046786 TaxID=3155471 RepID=UPI0033DB7A7B
MTEASRFGDHAARLADFHRIADTYFASDGLLTLGVSLSELFGLPWDRTVAELSAARERRALIVDRTGCVWGGALTGGVTEPDALGLLGPDMVHVHCITLDDDEWSALARSGGKVSISVETELNMGTAKEVLRWGTVNAADALGLGDRIGSLTPGKQADLQLVGGGAVEQHPRIDRTPRSPSRRPRPTCGRGWWTSGSSSATAC